MNYPIDFVIIWVDGQDENWRQQRAQYQSSSKDDNSEIRYRDWGLLRYWFRCAEKFAPWVRKIHFVTCGHLPSWLNKENPKLHIVKHEDYIPKEFLPTFNSTVIEIYLHKIKGISEHFVYFNDDMFIIRPIRRTDFFYKGKPCDMLAFQPIVANASDAVMSHTYLNNILVLCKYFNKRKNVCQHLNNYFHIGYPIIYFVYNFLEMFFPLYTGLYTVHGPSPFCKHTFYEIWKREKRKLLQMSLNRFRNENTLNQYLFREWQKLSNNFYPTNLHKKFKYFEIQNNNTKLIQTIKKQKIEMICINDAEITRDINHVRAEIQMAFKTIVPKQSHFEINSSDGQI